MRASRTARIRTIKFLAQITAYTVCGVFQYTKWLAYVTVHNSSKLHYNIVHSIYLKAAIKLRCDTVYLHTCIHTIHTSYIYTSLRLVMTLWGELYCFGPNHTENYGRIKLSEERENAIVGCHLFRHLGMIL